MFKDFDLEGILEGQEKKVEKSVADKIQDLKEEMVDYPTNLLYTRATFLLHNKVKEKLDRLVDSKELEVFTPLDRSDFRGFKTRLLNVAILDVLDNWEEEQGKVKQTLFSSYNEDEGIRNRVLYDVEEDKYYVDILGEGEELVEDYETAVGAFNLASEGLPIRSLDELKEGKKHTSAKKSIAISRSKKKSKKSGE